MSKPIKLTDLEPGDVINWAASNSGAVVTHVWTNRARTDGVVTFAIVWPSTMTGEWHVASCTWSADRPIYVIAQLRPTIPQADFIEQFLS